jgi:hypothetical protein
VNKTCCAGITAKQVQNREQVNQFLDETEYPYYIIVLKGSTGRFDYQGLYWHDGHGAIEKLHGPAILPNELDNSMVDTFFKYNVG